MKKLVALADKAIRRFVPELRLTTRNLSYLVEKRSAEKSVDFICDNMQDAESFYELKALWKFSFERIPQVGMILEFGVHSGKSVNYFASLTDRPIHGFDSFEGLPHDGTIPRTGAGQPKWYSGKMDLKGKVPKVAENVTLHVGWFDEVLPRFTNEHREETVALLHIDSDIYSSAKTILDGLADKLQPGTIIIFDEYLNYVGWERNEHRAFMEFVEKYKVEYEFVAYSYHQAATVEIISIGGN